MNLKLPLYLKRAFTPQPHSCEDRSASLTAAQLSAVERSLTNPDMRVPLRADFPFVLSTQNPTQLLEVITAELAKRGKTLESVGEITIAYPRKDTRLFPGYNNSKGEVASYDTIRALKKAWKRAGQRGRFPIKLLRADMIGETAYLDRSHNQDSLHVVTHRQQYVARRPWLGRSIPFLRADHADREHYFIIADQYVEQGTTVASLASYLTHNSGHVLAAVRHSDGKTPLAPCNDFGGFEGTYPALKGAFGAAANSNILAALGFFLARSAKDGGVTVSSDEALRHVEHSINRYGHSLTALTHWEALRLGHAVKANQLTYAQLLALPAPPSSALIKQQPPRVQM